jgi:hypothetical protein
LAHPVIVAAVALRWVRPVGVNRMIHDCRSPLAVSAVIRSSPRVRSLLSALAVQVAPT